MKKREIKNKNGCVEKKNFLDSKLFDELIDFANKNLDFLALNRYKNNEIDCISKILENKKFQDLTERYTGIKFSQLRKKMTTNINAKTSLLSSDTNLHYDKCYLNWVIPVRIENKLNPGLIIFPNSRKNPFLFLTLKILTKVVQSHYLLRSPKLLRFFGASYVRYKPNHAYIFDGYNSLHGVAWQKDDGVRCVVTINFSL